MGLLDDLKKQADVVKSQQLQAQHLQADKLKLVEEKMKQTFQYVNDLLKQLEVLKPTSPLMYSIPGVSNFVGLAVADSFIDYRRKRIGDKEYFDTIHFFIKWATGNIVVIDRDDAAGAQRARESLWVSRVKFTEEEKKSNKGIVIGAKFTIPVAVVTDITVKADHDKGQLLFDAKNLFGLGLEQLVVPAPAVDNDMLEDLARTLIGQPNNFRKYRTGVGAR